MAERIKQSEMSDKRMAAATFCLAICLFDITFERSKNKN